MIKYFLYTLLLFFSIVIFLVGSKSGIIILIFIYLISFLIFIKSRLLRSCLFIGLVLLSFYFLKFGAPENPFQRIYNAIHVAFSSNPWNEDGTILRLNVGKAALQIIKDNYLVGVGTGDVKVALLGKYNEMGLTGAYEKKLNAHNQFLQTFVALGIIGFLTLVATLIIPLVFAFRRKNYLYAAFLLIIILNFFTESMLETQAGVIFYAFFNSILFAWTLRSKDKSKNFVPDV